MSDKMMLTLADLHVLAATAERNGTVHNFPAVALQWAAVAHAEIEKLRSALRVAEGALMECSPCAHPECQAVQREWLEESIAGCRRALGA